MADPQSDRRLRRWLDAMLTHARPGSEVRGGFKLGKDGRVTLTWVDPPRHFVEETLDGGEQTSALSTVK